MRHRGQVNKLIKTCAALDRGYVQTYVYTHRHICLYHICLCQKGFELVISSVYPLSVRDSEKKAVSRSGREAGICLLEVVLLKSHFGWERPWKVIQHEGLESHLEGLTCVRLLKHLAHFSFEKLQEQPKTVSSVTSEYSSFLIQPLAAKEVSLLIYLQ